MAHAWKACWVQALAGSNPASSATAPCRGRPRSPPAPSTARSRDPAMTARPGRRRERAHSSPRRHHRAAPPPGRASAILPGSSSVGAEVAPGLEVLELDVDALAVAVLHVDLAERGGVDDGAGRTVPEPEVGGE